MAAAARFDTLDYARKLEAAGVPRTQAELQARALGDALAGSVATREDLANLERRMDTRFAAVEAKIDGRIDSLRHEVGGKIETLKWMFGVLVAINAATFVQLFLRH
ncbi:MAG TPA: DUF1640 domain-containing protein [Casimicrobiaceae bacterium]|nr:DUF1640 domain-containing protein [Casimicrobiaceae bacterium]